MRVALVGLVLVALLMSSLPSQAAAVAEGTLYLLPREEPLQYQNFTTAAPGAGAPVGVPSEPPDNTQTTWHWRTAPSPAAWRLERGATVDVHLVLTKLDRSVPVGNLEHPEGFGKLKVQAEVFHSNATREQVLGRAATTLDPRLPTEGPQHIPVSLVVPIEMAGEWFGPESVAQPTFGLRIVVTGYHQRMDPPEILVGSDETPSRVVVPGFPVAAFRAWEEAEAAQEACARLILQKLPCETAAPPPVPTEHETAPAPGFPWLIAILGSVVFVGALYLRRFNNP